MYMMWLCILFGTLLVVLAGGIYLVTRIGRFRWMTAVSHGRKWVRIALSAFVLVAFCLLIHYSLGFVNMCVVVIHLTVIWLFTEGIWELLKKCKIKIPETGLYLPGLMALVMTFAVLSYGWYVDRHVVFTEYSIDTDKAVEPLRIVQLTDSHVGTTFDGEGFGRYIDQINDLEPDLVLFTGDYMDGSSKPEDIRKANEALGRLRAKQGVYFVFGNHDKNAYGEADRRNYGGEDLIRDMKAVNITVLEDAVIPIAGGYSLMGRQDKTEANRASAAALMEQVPEGSFVIDMNHQPNDYAAEEAAGVDLVLSGHTHGGQLIPINEAGVWMGANDKTYGYEKRGNTHFIVSSGISDWAIDFKTGCKSEIVVIDIR